MDIEEIDPKWFKSHELFWGYRQNEQIEEYIQRAIAPLLDSGRVPVLITNLDPATDIKEIREIFNTKPLVIPGETILVRLALNSVHSIQPIADLMNEIVENARKTKQMPTWWPLIQAEFDLATWKKLKKALGENWNYTNIAMHPFMDKNTIRELKPQITVAQFFIGAADDIHESGTVAVDLKNCAGQRSPNKKTFNIFQYTKQIKSSGLNPTCIICGPSLPHWTVGDNKNRLNKYMAVFVKAADSLWSSKVALPPIEGA